jgi:hypothetical protein
MPLGPRQLSRAAQQKAQSVRSLERTSATIVHAGGQYKHPPRDNKPIIAGILANKRGWADPLKGLDEHLPKDPADPGFLNIGIALDTVCFDYTPTLDGDTVQVARTTSAPDQQLIHFVIRLFRQLQTIGTVPAVDMQAYEAAIIP